MFSFYDIFVKTQMDRLSNLFQILWYKSGIVSYLQIYGSLKKLRFSTTFKVTLSWCISL